MYSDARSHVWVHGQYSEEFGMGVGVHQGFALAHCPSSWYCRRCRVSSTPLYHGSFSILMTWCSSWTLRRSVTLSVSCGRLAWKVQDSMSTWSSRPTSWSLMLAMMFSRNLASILVLSAVVLPATTPSSAHKACCGTTGGAVAWLSEWLLTQTMYTPGVMLRLGPSIAEVWLKWMSTAPRLMWMPLSLHRWYAML